MSDTAEKPGRQSEDHRRLVVPELPARVLDTYARLWQLETWLRRLVYVELRALAGDNWASKIRRAEKLDGPRRADKRLTHMPTPEDNPLSYAQFPDLCSTLSDHWLLFEPFLPPKSIWEAKLEEIIQVRHRVAHFRSGNPDDLERVTQLLRDTDHGFWRFCTSYNHHQLVLLPSDDPVVEHFLHLDPFPWGPAGEGKWARYGIADPEARLGVTVDMLRRPWVTWSAPAAGKGFIYDVMVSARQNRGFDYRRFLQGTSDLHKHIVYIHLDNFAGAVRATIPALLGPERIIRIVNRIVEESLRCVAPNFYQLGRRLNPEISRSREGTAQRLANAWPEYVLGPANPLSFLAPDMSCSFFLV